MIHLKTYEEKYISINYPINEIVYLIGDYIDENRKKWNKDGWDVFHTDTDYYYNTYNIGGFSYHDNYSNKNVVGGFSYCEIERLDDNDDILFDDKEAVELAKKTTRLNIKYDFLVVGLDDIDFVGMKSKDFLTYEFQKDFLENHEDLYKFIEKVGINKKIKEEFDYLFNSIDLGLL